MSTPKTRLCPAERMQGINPFRVMTVLERARQLEQQGRSIVHLEVGEPDFPTVDPIIVAGTQALKAGLTHYTPAAGLPELRSRISSYYAGHHAVEVDPARILITPGASGALLLVSQLLLNPGDTVLMPDPGYPCNRNYVRLAGAQARLVPVDAENSYQPAIEQLEQYLTPQTTGLWLASPANPTGAVLDIAQLAALSQWSASNDCHLLLDEIYHGLDYGAGLPSAVQASPENIVVNSFSKYFGMTGWRLGWLVLPESLVPAANILAQNLFIAAATPSQYAALRAFDEDVGVLLQERREEFRRRRDFLHSALQELGFSVPAPTEGAFYIYAGISDLAGDSELFCQQLLEQEGVALTPGSDFGEYQANSHVRFAFTTGMPQLEMAVERLRRFLA